jgi:hypothetical protein
MHATITGQGADWISVDAMDGNAGIEWAPNEWITIGGQKYMIRSIDKEQGRIYLETQVAGSHVGTSIQGVDKMTWGVGNGHNTIWDPSEQKGFHMVYGNTYRNMVRGSEGESVPGEGFGFQPHSFFENYIYPITDPNKELGEVPAEAIGRTIRLKDGSVWRYMGVRGANDPLWERV